MLKGKKKNEIGEKNQECINMKEKIEKKGNDEQGYGTSALRSTLTLNLL